MAPLHQAAAALLLACSTVLAHTGAEAELEAEHAARYLEKRQTTLKTCTPMLTGTVELGLKRRTALAQELRSKVRRDFATYNFTHEDESVSIGDDALAKFADTSSVVTWPSDTTGPAWVDGFFIRNDLTEDQEGIPMYLDMRFIDVNTCEPAAGIYVDLWAVNSTGIYGGTLYNTPNIVNGNFDDTNNLQETWLRGIQATDSDGIVHWRTIFPGHYSGRATHMHFLTYASNYTIVRNNNTVASGTPGAFNGHVSSVGQFFFDQELIDEADTLYPYNISTQPGSTPNSLDPLITRIGNVTDPFVRWAKIGEDLSEGVMAWLTVAIDTESVAEHPSGATWTKEGSKLNPEPYVVPEFLADIVQDLVGNPDGQVENPPAA